MSKNKNNEKDMFIEELWSKKDKNRNKDTKKINSKNKGNRAERELAKIFKNKFGKPFSRALGSGARTSQVDLPEYAKSVLSGDICVPEGFKWVIECKSGYESDINLTDFAEGISVLDSFMSHAINDAKYCDKKPLICWKRNRKKWIAFLRMEDCVCVNKLSNYIVYNGWVGVNLDELFDITSIDFWFQ